MTTKKIHIIIWNPHHIEPLIKMGLTHFIIMHPTFCVGYPEKTNYFDEETLKNLINSRRLIATGRSACSIPAALKTSISVANPTTVE